MKIYCISWKDERWSADKETLKGINEMINKNAKSKSSFIYHYSISFAKWIAKKIKR